MIEIINPLMMDKPKQNSVCSNLDRLIQNHNRVERLGFTRREVDTTKTIFVYTRNIIQFNLYKESFQEFATL